MPNRAEYSPVMRLTPAEVKAKYGYKTGEMFANVKGLSDTLEEIKAQMIKDGRLKIVNGKNVWRDKSWRDNEQ